MGLSRRCLETTLTGIAPRDALIVRDYTKEYCGPDAHVSSLRFPINHIVNLNLKAIFYAINYMARLAMVHSRLDHIWHWLYPVWSLIYMTSVALKEQVSAIN